MRKIERLMNEAITNGLNWKSGNTQVITAANNVSSVYLHGNLIARIGENFVQLFDGGWQSNTTKSRLNAICDVHAVTGEGVYQKKYQWFVRLYDNNSKEFVTEEFFSGFVLGEA